LKAGNKVHLSCFDESNDYTVVGGMLNDVGKANFGITDVLNAGVLAIKTPQQTTDETINF
jgi:hypothetical protein